MKTTYELEVDDDGFATLVTRQPLGPVRGCSREPHAAGRGTV